jgi:hypothetical protein
MAIHAEQTTSESGVRAPASSLTSDCDRPPADGKPRPERDRDIGDTECHELSIGVDRIVVTQGQESRGGDALVVRE